MLLMTRQDLERFELVCACPDLMPLRCSQVEIRLVQTPACDRGSSGSWREAGAHPYRPTGTRWIDALLKMGMKFVVAIPTAGE